MTKIFIFLFFYLTFCSISLSSFAEDKEYDVKIVEKGDTFFSIAKNSNLTLEGLRKLNNKSNYNIFIGEKITILKGQNSQKNQTLEKNIKNKSNEKSDQQSNTQEENPHSKKVEEKIEIINTFGKASKYSEGVVISKKPGSNFYSPVTGSVIYKGFLSSLGGDVIILEVKKNSKKLKVIFFNLNSNIKINHFIEKNEFIGNVGYQQNPAGIFVIVTDEDGILIPFNRII